MNTDELIQNAGGELNAQTAANILEGLEGDTGTTLEIGGVPDASATNATTTEADQGKQEGTEQQGAQQATTAPADDELNADNAVILAKDGKHTISYDKLAEARKAAQDNATALAAANAELAELRAAAQTRAAAGEQATTTDKQVEAAQAAINAGVDPALFGDFSEEALANGIQKLVDQRVNEALAQVDAKLNPIQQKQVVDANAAHLNAIYTAHPDADSIVESKEFEGWVSGQPSFVQQAYAAVLEKGSAQQVVELFDSFKKATGTTQAAPAADPAAAKAAAQAAIASAQNAVPNSLSDIPGGRPAGASREEQMAAMNSVDLLSNMENMSPDQINDYLNRI